MRPRTPPGPRPRRILLVTGTELAVATLAVRAPPAATFVADRVVGGSLLENGTALLTSAEPGSVFLSLQATPATDDVDLRLELIAADGFTRLVTTDESVAVPYVVQEGAVVRVQRLGVVKPVAATTFTFVASSLVRGSTLELEPNDDGGSRSRSVTSSSCPQRRRLPEPSADLDLPSRRRSVAVVEVSASPARGPRDTPRTSGCPPQRRRRFPGAGQYLLSEDPAMLLGPSLEPAYLELTGLAGSTGPYLAVLRPAIVIEELGWSGDVSFVELRALPGMVVPALRLRVEDADGDALGPDIEVPDMRVGDSGLVLVAADDSSRRTRWTRPCSCRRRDASSSC